jgi:RNA polymerase sigma-70 factor (ECF subfamily)
MADDLSDRTRRTLLAKLRDANNRAVWNQAWQEFFDRYSPLMLAWCRRWGLQDSDAQDIIANVLARLGQRLKSFEYDPTRRFRSWLRTVVHNEVRDFFEAMARRPGDHGAGGTRTAGLDRVPDRTAAADELCREIEANRRLLDRAMGEVRPRVEPHTWAAFYQTAVDGRAADEVAAELGMTKVAVYKAKSRVLELIRQAVDQLRGDTPPG